MACHRIVPGGIVVAVRVTPRAPRNSVEGVSRLADDAEVLQIRVHAPPAEGAANKAVVATLAKALRVPKSALAVVSGAGARLKQVRVEGDSRVLSAMIEAWKRPS